MDARFMSRSMAANWSTRRFNGLADTVREAACYPEKGDETDRPHILL